MKYYTSKITRKGQVTLPMQIREKLNVSVGDRVVFKLKDPNHILVETYDKDVTDFFDMPVKRKLKAYKGKDTDIEKAKQEEAKKVVAEGL